MEESHINYSKERKRKYASGRRENEISAYFLG